MNNQLKLLVYIVFLVAVFFFVQQRFDFLDIDLVETKEKLTEEDLPETEEVDEDVEQYVLIYENSGDTLRVDVEVADTAAERALGLSNRRYLGDYNGMLFVYESDVNEPFWMKDMYISLDILFIDESGFIVDIVEENEPCSETTHCPRIFSSTEYRYVLEVNAGFCSMNDIVVGQSMSFHLATE